MSGILRDSAVESTNDDATSCKRSAVQFGYWNDPYIRHMAKFVERKAPEIHLGYYTRVQGLRHLLEKSVQMIRAHGKPIQIINLGAGFDTLFWRLKVHDHIHSFIHSKEGKHSSLLLLCPIPWQSNLSINSFYFIFQDELPAGTIRNFIEVDYPGVTARKCLSIKKCQSLLEKVTDEDGEVKLSKTDLHGKDYHIVGADFTQIPALEQKLSECAVDYAIPTIFLSECVLIYISPGQVNGFLSWTQTRFTSALVFLNHEQINMSDRFGQVKNGI